MLNNLLTATKRTKNQTTSGVAKRRILRPEQLENRRLLATFQGLGDLAGGEIFSEAFGVSDDGQVVVGRSGDSTARQPIRWSAAEGMTALATDAVYGGEARGASANGSFVAGGIYSNLNDRGSTGGSAVWESESLSAIADPASLATNISSDGRFIVGTNRDAGGDLKAYLWDSQNAEMSPLGSLFSSGESVARGVSSDGNVVAGYSRDSDGAQPFRWDATGGITSLHVVGAGYDVSADGSAIVGYARVDEVARNGKIRGSHLEAFRWSDNGDIDYLGDLPGGSVSSVAEAVSGDGSIIVGTSSSSIGSEAFIWDETNGMQSLQDVLVNDHGLDLTGWQLRVITDVTADGMTFVGTGLNPDGYAEAFIASFGPPAAGVSVSPVSGLETSEGGDTSSFEVVLDTQPTSDVTIGISSSDTTEGVVDTSSLIFTTSNWDVPQTVTVSGVDDTNEDGNIAFQIVTSAASSADTNYDGLDAPDVAVTNVDDDGMVSNAIYVGSIDFESRRGGQDWRAVFQVFVDSNQNGLDDSGDAAAAGADITVSFNGKTFTGIIGSDGLFRTQWQRKLASGQYEAEVVDLAFADYAWDLNIGEDDSDDEDDLPDATLVL